MKPHEAIYQNYIGKLIQKRTTNRTTRIYVKIGTFEAALWEKKYRPQMQRVYASDEQIKRAREQFRLINN